MRGLVVLGAVAAALGGCSARTPHPSAAHVTVEAAPKAAWEGIASADDAARIAALPELWSRARGTVPMRLKPRMRAEGELVDPAAALALPTPPPGSYRCRLVRFGGRGGFRSFAPDFCYVDGDAKALAFTKQTGSNLPGGWLHPDTPTRLVFLGAVPRKGEAKAPGYGIVPAQDVAAVVERVGPFRWRMVMLRAGRDGVLDLYELVPVVPEVAAR